MLWRLWRTVHHAGGEQGGVDWGERERIIFSSQAFVNTSEGVNSKRALAGW